MIYHLLDEAEPFSESKGGAISRWAANVLREGGETIICPSYDASWGFPAARIYCLPGWEKTKFPVHAALYRLPWPLQKAAYLRIFAELLERVRPGDLLYIHNRPECAAVLATVAQQRGFQLVLHMHNSHLTRASQGQLAALKDVPIVFCSDFLRREIQATFPGYFQKTYLVYNGADAGLFRSRGETVSAVPTIIFTGRVVPYKGVHILLEAMGILQKRGVEALCKVVGGSGFGTKRRSGYIRRIERLRPSNTEFLGYMSGEAFASLLRTADIFCAPSIWNDPFPLAPLEAMASGLAVVASQVGGIPEALAYGGGVLVPPKDPEALANALQNLIEDPAQRKALSIEGMRAFREHFLWSNVREQYEAVILDLGFEMQRHPLASASENA